MLFIDEYKGLHKEMYIMAVAAFINCFGEFISIFFSLYLTQLLNYSTASAGLLVSVMYFSHIPGSLIGGKLCDTIGRKKIMVFSQMIMGICYISCGIFINNRYAPAFIVLGKFFDGITDPAREAFEADITTPEQRRAAFSLIYQVTNIAFAIGPLFAAILYRKYPSALFIGSGALQLTVMIIVMLFIHETFDNRKICQKTKEKNENSALKELFLRPNLLIFSFGMFLCLFAYKQISFSLPLQLSELFGEQGTSLFSTIIMINSIFVILFNSFVLKLSQKGSTVPKLVLAAVLYAVVFGLFGFVKIPIAFYALTILYSIGELFLSNNDKVYRVNNTPSEFRGRFSAILQLFKTASRLFAPIAGGFFISFMTYKTFWLVIGCITSFAIICFCSLQKWEVEK